MLGVLIIPGSELQRSQALLEAVLATSRRGTGAERCVALLSAAFLVRSPKSDRHEERLHTLVHVAGLDDYAHPVDYEPVLGRVYGYDQTGQAWARSCPGHVSGRGVSGTRPDASSVVTP